ncbi:MAG: hypothetical protein AB7F89_01970 [Pirellulaceae bacterium]
MISKNDPDRRRAVLRKLGGNEADIAELLVYNENRFDVARLPPPPVLPLPDEPHVATWRRYAAEAGETAWDYLRARLPQLRIPVRAGVSTTESYGDVIRRGGAFDAAAFGGELSLERPGLLSLVVYGHAAGALPVLRTAWRPDFETLTRALAFRSEPRAINPSVNAQFVAGIINWDRIHAYAADWSATHDPSGWREELARVAREDKWRLHDCLILVCEAPYSDVASPGGTLAATTGEWQHRSEVLRLEHEFCHYATKRLYGYMALNLLDEFICDWAGMTATLGRFDGGCMALFLGLGAWPRVNPKGRVHTYRGNLSDGAFELLCGLAVQAAEALENLTARHYDPARRTQFLLALTQLTLENLLQADHFSSAYAWAASQLREVPDRA